VIFLHAGQIEEQGASAQLFDAPKSPRLKQFLRSSITIDNKSAR
jgi:ABC-type histidine transport system ATPase subunit